MKPKCAHRFSISGSVTTESKRILTLCCNLCGKEKTRRKALGRVGKASSTTHPQKPPGSLKTHRKPIRKVSEKRKAINKEYSVLRKQFLEDHPRCAVFPHLPSDQIHHVSGRWGKLMLDTLRWIALSAEGHRKIHDNPAWAKAQKYIIPIYS